MTIFHHRRCLEYSSPGHPERPERIGRTAPLLKDRHPDWAWRRPTAATGAQLLRAHSREHVEGVANALEHFDLDTPFYPNMEVHARRSAGAAIEAMRSALRGENALSLMRPPGHHATRDGAMGFCYFNNVAEITEAHSAISRRVMSRRAHQADGVLAPQCRTHCLDCRAG